MRGCVHLRVPSCLQMARGREARLSPMHTQVGTGMSCSCTTTPRLSDIPGGSSLGRRGRDDAGGEVSGNTVGGACPWPGWQRRRPCWALSPQPRPLPARGRRRQGRPEQPLHPGRASLCPPHRGPGGHWLRPLAVPVPTAQHLSTRRLSHLVCLAQRVTINVKKHCTRNTISCCLHREGPGEEPGP